MLWALHPHDAPGRRSFWWPEGFVGGITGWTIGPQAGASVDRSAADDASALFRSLGELILPLYREPADGWPRLVRSTIAFNVSFFRHAAFRHAADAPAARGELLCESSAFWRLLRDVGGGGALP